ncbi:MAG: site-specific integrase [Clostridia bacterium]|nr:site-specific integrase [Clostridia bacterium]
MAKKRKNGDGMLRKRSDGRWEARVVIGYDEKNLPITKNVTALNKEKCIEKLEKLKQEIGIIQNDKTKAEMPFGDWMDFWYNQYAKITLKQTTQSEYESLIYKHIIPKIGKIALNKLTQNDLQQFYTRLKLSGRKIRTEIYGNGLSDRMIRACHILCQKSLAKAVEENLIRTNPAIECKLPPKKSEEMKVLTREEMQRFMAQAKYDGYFELFILELSTGMRRGEILGLQWDDLNMRTGELKISRQVAILNGRIHITEPKTQTSIRTVILPNDIVKMLAKYKQTINSKWVFPSPVKEDMPRNPSAVRKILDRTLVKSGCKHIRFHDLRHTFATTALANGMDIKTLSAIIGHNSAETTLNTYTHITDEMQKSAANKIEQGIMQNTSFSNQGKKVHAKNEKTPCEAKFEPIKPTRRKSGTGCISKINDNLYEGSYSPRLADGKRKKYNVYAKTREECEIKLATMIKQLKTITC